MVAALEETGAGAPPASPPARQLALLPSLREGEAPEPLCEGQEPEFQGGDAGEGGKRGPGRPAGAKNRRTGEIVDYISRRYGFPLERLAQIYSADTGELARELGLKRGEALAEQRAAAAAALPYMHQKRPIEVDVSNKGVFELTIVESVKGEAARVINAHAVDLGALVSASEAEDGEDPEGEEYQGVSAVLDVQSDGGQGASRMAASRMRARSD